MGKAVYGGATKGREVKIGETTISYGVNHEMEHVTFTKPCKHETGPSRVSNEPSARTGPGRDSMRRE